MVSKMFDCSEVFKWSIVLYNIDNDALSIIQQHDILNFWCSLYDIQDSMNTYNTKHTMEIFPA